jgi:hypothetical protein
VAPQPPPATAALPSAVKLIMWEFQALSLPLASSAALNAMKPPGR